ncbi:bifunctional metallophosphatase/5'-nucleotidase [Schaalia odontolytica]|uniref:bifunctional metallophosphatase/5'-nucleotidase n=1 Tax=Schaalia odontolytica TaxID=1660 RepID=UPI00211C8377|nr:bifunctional UDP-sugar hydrolase/5'-nucleotidase [Schaalia odontolytica]UUO92731.1 bifunctional metallophosphatase/5'-nucleotidase [Schaalia odontolytica]
MRTPWRHVALASTAAIALAFVPTAALADAQEGTDAPITLDLYNLTDVHGHIQQVSKKGVVREAGLPAMNCYLKKATQENPNSSFTLLGDNIGASPYISGSLKDNPTIAALNTMNPLASTIGNHELDMGQAVFKQRVDGSNPSEFVQATFPYLGANIQGMGTYGEGTPYLGDYKLWKSPSGITVAFIGAIAEDVPYKLSPGTTAGLTFTDPIKRIDSLAAQLKSSGTADVVIAMLDDDVKNNYPKVGKDVDGLMGGDTHVPYEFDHVNSHERFDSANPLLAGIASGSYTDNLGLIRLTIDPKTRKVSSADSILIPAADVAACGADPATQAVVDKAEADSKEAGKRVVATGYTTPFKRGVFTTPEGATDPGSNRGIESSLGDLVADSLRETILTPDGKSVDIGMIMAGGLRADLVPNEDGTITYAQTYEVEPFSDELGYVTLKGSDVKDALEQQWKTDLNSQNSRPMLKLGLSSNVRYTYDPAKPYGQRITSVTINGEPLKADATYTVGSVSFLLAGGDSFEALTRGGAATTNGNLDRDSFNEYLAENSGGKKGGAQAMSSLAPREAKSSIGLTLPTEPVADGATVTIPLRGLSFSEGPSITSKVRVSAGGAQAVADVDNSLVDAHASDAASIITTDGAGQATVSVTVVGSCRGKAAGEVVGAPVSVATDFATVVEASDGVTIPVACAGDSAAQPSPTPDAGGDATPSAPTPSASPSPSTKRGGLARTGAYAEALLGAAAIAAIGGAGVLARRRANRYQSEN